MESVLSKIKRKMKNINKINQSIKRKVVRNNKHFILGVIIYRNSKNMLHRENGPAVIDVDGNQYWCKNGEYHRENGPAVIWHDGSQVWYKNGKSHRDNGPAAIYADNSKEWWKNDELIKRN